MLFDLEDGEEERDLVAGRRADSHLAVGVDWVVTWPARTHDAPARRRQLPVTRCTTPHAPPAALYSLLQPDMELGHWVTGSINGSFGSFFTSGSPGHHSDPMRDPSFFPVFDKMPKMQNVHRKCCNDESHCQVSFVGLKSLEVSPCNELLLLPMIIKHSLA